MIKKGRFVLDSYSIKHLSRVPGYRTDRAYSGVIRLINCPEINSFVIMADPNQGTNGYVIRNDGKSDFFFDKKLSLLMEEYLEYMPKDVQREILFHLDIFVG